MPKTLYLIDGHAQIHRAFHAVEGLETPDGRPSGAIFGFTRTLHDVINKHNPDYLIAVFDSPGKTFRHERYPDYKATRKPTPPELLQQIPTIIDIVKAY
ncbi:MAG: 5'-3' exonuclease, partial [Planctomycetes bacterium]|nr:5'-3' exonuclease [Planctomycetota bacterium]